MDRNFLARVTAWINKCVLNTSGAQSVEPLRRDTELMLPGIQAVDLETKLRMRPKPRIGLGWWIVQVVVPFGAFKC